MEWNVVQKSSIEACIWKFNQSDAFVTIRYSRTNQALLFNNVRYLFCGLQCSLHLSWNYENWALSSVVDIPRRQGDDLGLVMLFQSSLFQIKVRNYEDMAFLMTYGFLWRGQQTQGCGSARGIEVCSTKHNTIDKSSHQERCESYCSWAKIYAVIQCCGVCSIFVFHTIFRGSIFLCVVRGYMFCRMYLEADEKVVESRKGWITIKLHQSLRGTVFSCMEQFFRSLSERKNLPWLRACVPLTESISRLALPAASECDRDQERQDVLGESLQNEVFNDNDWDIIGDF